MQAVVAGGTGLVGAALLDELSARQILTTALARRAGSGRQRLTWTVTDLSHLKASHIPPGTDTAFCALGTTIRAAGSQPAFRAVDYGLVLSFARACRKAGVSTFALVSSAGAHPESALFYSRVKGEVERDVSALQFPSLYLLRPSLLLGTRHERRPLERAGMFLARALQPILPPAVRAIHAKTVARALVSVAHEARGGVHVVSNAKIVRLGA